MEEEYVEVEIKSLLESKQYTRLRQKVAELNDADIAVVMEELDEEDLLKRNGSRCFFLPGSGKAAVYHYFSFRTRCCRYH